MSSFQNWDGDVRLPENDATEAKRVEKGRLLSPVLQLT